MMRVRFKPPKPPAARTALRIFHQRLNRSACGGAMDEVIKIKERTLKLHVSAPHPFKEGTTGASPSQQPWICHTAPNISEVTAVSCSASESHTQDLCVHVNCGLLFYCWVLYCLWSGLYTARNSTRFFLWVVPQFPQSKSSSVPLPCLVLTSNTSHGALWLFQQGPTDPCTN